VIAIDEASWQSAIAAGRIFDLKGRLDAPPSEEIIMALAGSLCAHRRYEEAVRALEEFSKRTDRGDVKVSVSRLLARSYAGLNKIKQAEDAAGVVEPAARAGIRLAAADELWARNRKGAAMEMYRSLADNDQKEIARRALQRVALYTSDNRIAGFEKTLKDFKERYPDDPFAEYCLGCWAGRPSGVKI
jgi:thioredoxin-like negative regulator of GroEL